MADPAVDAVMARPPVNPGLDYLPRSIKVGDKLRLLPSILNKQDNGSREKPQPMACVVIYVHPKLRFATVKFPGQKHETMGHWVDASWRENWPIMPPERQLAREDLEPAGWHKGSNAPTIADRLQERSWDGMTIVQIAATLGVGQKGVWKAIHKLADQGIVIQYKKGERGNPNAANHRNGGVLQFQSEIGSYRRAAGLTQQELADKIGVSKSTVLCWERGKYAAKWNLLEAALPGVTEWVKKNGE